MREARLLTAVERNLVPGWESAAKLDKINIRINLKYFPKFMVTNWRVELAMSVVKNEKFLSF
jgi:hypothetical protein